MAAWRFVVTPTTDDVQLLLEHVRAVGLEPTEVSRGWNHIGAIICDAALQRRAKYATHVRPRVARLIADWPDASTLTGFKDRMRSESLAEQLQWNGRQKLAVIDGLVGAFDAANIDTVSDLSGVLSEPSTAAEFRGSLRKVRNVGPKTVDYINILAGSTGHVAVDMHIMGFVKEAGVAGYTDYSSVSQLIHDAAAAGGWSPGALDAAIWKYRSER